MKGLEMTAAAFTLLVCLCASTAWAQSTGFTYQGRLLDGSMPPTASYDFEFKLFADQAGGVPRNQPMHSQTTKLMAHGVLQPQLARVMIFESE